MPIEKVEATDSRVNVLIDQIGGGNGRSTIIHAVYKVAVLW